MSTTTTTNATKPATRPDSFTKSQWDKATYTAYMSLISLAQGKVSVAQFLKDNLDLFTRSGVPADEAHVLSLVIAMAKDTTMSGEKVRKVNPIGSLRQFFNRTWAEKDALEVRYKTPTAPKESKPRSGNGSKKGPTKAELEAQNAELTRKLAEIQALMGISVAA